MMDFRKSPGFGKGIECWILGRMLIEGLDVYVPLVDDKQIDAVVRRQDGSFIEVQIKATSNRVGLGDTGFFAAIKHEGRPNYWFIFYSQRLDRMWILSSREFALETNPKSPNSRKNIGEREIQFCGMRKNKETKEREEYVLPRYEKYLAKDFSRLRDKLKP